MKGAAYQEERKMSQNIDWGSLGFGYVPTEYRYVAKYKDGAWDEGQLTTESTILSERGNIYDSNGIRPGASGGDRHILYLSLSGKGKLGQKRFYRI